jgi:hypothetical protein
MLGFLNWLAGKALMGTNLLGLLLFAAAFGPLAVLFQDSTKLVEALLIGAGGCIACLLDLGYRKAMKHETFVEPTGPQILYLPAWILGGVWVVVGVVKTIIALLEQPSG